MNNVTANTDQGDQSFYGKILSQFNYAPLTVLYKFMESLDTQEYMEVLRAMMEKARRNEDINKQIHAWEQERLRPNRTRFVVKLINHTDKSFAVGNNNLNLNTDEQHFISIVPWDIQTLKFDLTYARRLGNPSKDIFKHFIMFGDQDLGFRFDFGLRVNTSFGVISPTLTPVQTHKVTSVGATPIKCITRITHAASEEPYSFTVEIVLS